MPGAAIKPVAEDGTSCSLANSAAERGGAFGFVGPTPNLVLQSVRLVNGIADDQFA